MHLTDTGVLKLTNRQLEILKYLTMGYTNVEIGRILKVSDNTVKSHVARIYATLDVTNRTEAALCYKEFQMDMKLDSNPVIILEPFKYCETDFLDISIDAPHPLSLRLQMRLLSLLARKKFLSVIKSNVTNGKYNDSLQGYLLSGIIQKRPDCIDISIYFETYPQGLHLWNYTFNETISDLDSTIDWSANKIVASLIYYLISKEVIIPIELQLKEKNMFQNILAGFHLVNLATCESLENAQKLFDSILEFCPSNISALYGKCFASYSSIINHFKDPKADFLIVKNCCKSISEISKDCTETWLAQGMLNLLDQDINGAIVSFQNAHRLDPSLQEAYFMLTQLYTISGDYQNGKIYLEQAISLCPDCQYRGNNLVVISLIYFGLEMYDIAVKFFEQSIYLQEGNMIGTILYICSLYYSGNNQKAFEVSKNVTINQVYISQIIGLVDKNILDRIYNALSNVGINII